MPPVPSCISTPASSLWLSFMPRAASTMGGPPMPTDEPNVPITMSENPARLAWPAKDGPDTMAIVGHPAGQLGHAVEELEATEGAVELQVAEAAARMAGPAAAAVDEEDDRPAVLVGQGEQPLEAPGAIAAALSV